VTPGHEERDFALKFLAAAAIPRLIALPDGVVW